MKHGKNYRNALKKYDSAALFSVPKAVDLVKELKFAKFDETVEVHVSLKIGKNQSVRDTVVLPHQFRGEKRVLVFCKEDRVKEALDAGAAYAGAAEYIDKVKGGWLDFDVAVATPDMMGKVGRLGKVLGPRNLMPNPKTGTVTMDVAKAVADIKGGKIDFRVDRNSNLHFIIGKASFSAEQLAENFAAALEEVNRLKPSSAKGRYISKATIATTFGPGIPVDPAEVTA